MIYGQLFWVFFKIGLFGFGGGYAMLSLIQDEIVTEHQWLTSGEFTDIVAISQMTPGPIGINSATYVGHKVTDSVWGSILATTAVSLPSLLLVFGLSLLLRKVSGNRWIKAAFDGLRPATVGLIASAALLLMLNPKALYNFSWDELLVRDIFPDWSSIAIFLAVFVIAIKRWIPPIPLLAIAGLTGLLVYS